MAEMLSESDKKKIVEALQAKGANRACPRCGNGFFSLIDGYFSTTVQASPIGLQIGGVTVPSVVVVCNQCGWLAQHALGSLGMLPKPPEPAPAKDGGPA